DVVEHVSIRNQAVRLQEVLERRPIVAVLISSCAELKLHLGFIRIIICPGATHGTEGHHQRQHHCFEELALHRSLPASICLSWCIASTPPKVNPKVIIESKNT